MPKYSPLLIFVGIVAFCFPARAEMVQGRFSGFIEEQCVPKRHPDDGRDIEPGVPLNLNGRTTDLKLSLVFEFAKKPSRTAQWNFKRFSFPTAPTKISTRSNDNVLGGIYSIVRWGDYAEYIVVVRSSTGVGKYSAFLLSDLETVTMSTGETKLWIPEEPDAESLAGVRTPRKFLDWKNVQVDDAIDVIAEGDTPTRETVTNVFVASGRRALEILDGIGLRGKPLRKFILSFGNIEVMKRAVAASDEPTRLFKLDYFLP